MPGNLAVIPRGVGRNFERGVTYGQLAGHREWVWMCPLPPKVEAFDTIKFTTVNFYCLLSVFT